MRSIKVQLTFLEDAFVVDYVVALVVVNVVVVALLVVTNIKLWPINVNLRFLEAYLRVCVVVGEVVLCCRWGSDNMLN